MKFSETVDTGIKDRLFWWRSESPYGARNFFKDLGIGGDLHSLSTLV